MEHLDHQAASQPRTEHQVAAQLAYDFDPERTVSARVVSRAGRINVFVAYRSVVRAGLATYVLLGDPNTATTQAPGPRSSSSRR